MSPARIFTRFFFKKNPDSFFSRNFLLVVVNHNRFVRSYSCLPVFLINSKRLRVRHVLESRDNVELQTSFPNHPTVDQKTPFLLFVFCTVFQIPTRKGMRKWCLETKVGFTWEILSRIARRKNATRCVIFKVEADSANKKNWQFWEFDLFFLKKSRSGNLLCFSRGSKSLQK